MQDSPDSGVEVQEVQEVQDSTEEAETKPKGDPHCYECKVKYRDPGPSDLMMFLHALRYQVDQKPDTNPQRSLIYNCG